MSGQHEPPQQPPQQPQHQQQEQVFSFAYGVFMCHDLMISKGYPANSVSTITPGKPQHWSLSRQISWWQRSRQEGRATSKVKEWGPETWWILSWPQETQGALWPGQIQPGPAPQIQGQRVLWRDGALLWRGRLPPASVLWPTQGSQASVQVIFTSIYVISMYCHHSLSSRCHFKWIEGNNIWQHNR